MRLVKDQIESLRYVNHLWPVLILRFYTSYVFFAHYYKKMGDDFLNQPKLSAAIDEYLYSSDPPSWVQSFFVDVVQENWAAAAAVITNIEWLLGFLFLIGFLNRPAAIVGLIFVYMMSFVSNPALSAQALPLLMILFTLFVFGSGRVGGLDYFFYKRQRGLVW